MLGTFLEISVYAPDIRESVAFYEALGFQHATVGETWSHPYAVLSDGRIAIGLHRYEFESPSLTYVRPGLADHLETLRENGIKFEFCKTGDEDFHEAGFFDPNNLMVTLLEARTFSPPFFENDSFSLLGHFEELSLPVRSADASTAFWQCFSIRRVRKAM